MRTLQLVRLQQSCKLGPCRPRELRVAHIQVMARSSEFLKSQGSCRADPSPMGFRASTENVPCPVETVELGLSYTEVVPREKTFRLCPRGRFLSGCQDRKTLCSQTHIATFTTSSATSSKLVWATGLVLLPRIPPRPWISSIGFVPWTFKPCCRGEGDGPHRS